MNAPVATGRVVPTLTEVLTEDELGMDLNTSEASVDSVMIDLSMPPELSVEAAPALAETAGAQRISAEKLLTPHSDAALEAKLTQQVLLDVQRQVDLMLEYRLREALAPSLARVCDLLIREARDELSVTLRDVVARAVAQELARQRSR